MYKVFFNASSFTLCSQNEISLKSNKDQFIEIQQASELEVCVAEFEKSDDAIELHFVCPNVEEVWREFMSHYLVIQAAGGVVENALGEILVIRRMGKWDLPKGKVEQNETVSEAAIREVEEECGISGVEISGLIGSSWHMYRSPYHAPGKNLVLKETCWFSMAYRGVKSPQPQIEEDIEEVRWMKRSDLDVFFNNTYPNLISLMSFYLDRSKNLSF